MKAGVRQFHIDTPLGPLSVALSDGGVQRLDFGMGLPESQVPKEMKPLFSEVKSQLREYFSGKRRCFDLPLAPYPPGTPFQQAVWRALCEVPYGQVISYSDLAGWSGNPKAQRAAAGACGANRIAVIIPCHRAVAKGGLGGFGGGLHLKKKLLALESAPTL